MTPIARLGAVSLDTPDVAGLSAFYRELLGLEVLFESDTFIALKGASVLLTVQRVDVDDHQPASWPSGPVPKQLHLELAVDDLDVAEAAAVGLGAAKADVQPSPESWRVLIDPAGHPFCITILIPDV
jgi:catechol 2,3-dioxygenase-like lactoylglutathione lyase family enzyme